MSAGTPKRYRVDNVSPIFQYQRPGEWGEGDINLDQRADEYYNSTFSVTQQPDASMSFRFTGTSITVTGAKRFNHGNYTVLLDGMPSTMDGHDDAGVIQTTLFRADDLPMGPHNIILTNRPNGGRKFLDIDYVEWESIVNGTETQTVDDADEMFQYEPSDAWSTDFSNHTAYASNTGHFATSSNAMMSLKFYGDAIELFGSVGADHGTYSISLDGTESGSFNASKKFYLPQQVLFIADGLGPGEHTLELTTGSDGVIGIDQAVITGTGFVSPLSSSSNSLSVGAIVGIVIGAVAVLVLFVVGFMLGRKELRRRKRDVDVVNTAGVPVNGMTPFTLPLPYETTQNASYNTKVSLPQSSSNSIDTPLNTSNPGISSCPPYPTKSRLLQGSTDNTSNTSNPVMNSTPAPYPTKSCLFPQPRPPPASSHHAAGPSTLHPIAPSRQHDSSTMITDAASVFHLLPEYTHTAQPSTGYDPERQAFRAPR